MLKFIKKNRFFLLGLLLLAFIVIQNIFPTGYVFGGGDTTQFIQAKENILGRFLDWNSRGFLFYSFFAFLDFLHISDTIQLSFYLGIFIFGSYIFFYLFSHLIFPQISEGKKVAGSLFYALNLYTLFIFTGNWGYSYFPSLYIFIPLLIGLFLKFLKTQKNIWGIFFVLTLFLGSSGFGNPAFLLSFIIFLGVLFFSFLLFGYLKINTTLILKLLLIIFLALLVNSFWLLPTLSKLGQGVASLENSEIVEFNWWIAHTANPILKTLSLNHYSQDYFPYDFYYKSLNSLKPFFLFLSFLPILIISWALFFKKKLLKQERVIFLALWSLLIIFVILVARLINPFKVINYYIYHLPGFITLRGYDKTAIFVPFILATLLLLTISKIKAKKILFIIFGLILITPLPFYLGKLQQTAGYRVNSEKDYKKASMSFLIKIPEDYYFIQQRINNDPEKSFIATLPETYNDGSGIVYYPKWNFYGSDITKLLYNKNFIDANSSNFKKWNPSSAFSQQEKNFDYLPQLLGMMSSKYILYHLDAPEDSVKQTQYKMNQLEKNGKIKNLVENDYFILYEIKDSYFLPYISYQAETFEWRNDPVWIERGAGEIRGASKEASFQEINPKKFEIDFEDSSWSKNIILSEKFDPLWRAYAIYKNGRKQELKNHFIARGWSNGWKIENPKEIKKLVIEYYPTHLMWWGIWISGITVLFLIGYLIRYCCKSKVLK